MLIMVLEVVHYPPPGSSWETINHANPDWETIVSWLEKLDRNEYPFLWLHLGKHEDGDEPEHSLNVMGGRGEFAFCIFRAGHHIYFRDPSRSKDVVRIWESDQGSRVEETELCGDQATVLKIVRHFAETGETLPEVHWFDDYEP